MKVMIVDDDYTTIKLSELWLTKQGYEVSVLTDPERTLEVVEDIRPDVILLDIYMPKKNGLDIAQDIRNSNIHRNIPIIAHTSLDLANKKLLCNFNSFFSKGDSGFHLLSLIERELSKASVAIGLALGWDGWKGYLLELCIGL